MFVALLASTVAVATANQSASKRTQCVVSRAAELAELAACGDKGSINYCLSHHPAKLAGAADDSDDNRNSNPPSRLVQAADLEVCFRHAGCTAPEAAVEAEWTIRRCDELGDSPSMADLRRRHPQHEPRAAAVTPAPTPIGLGDVSFLGSAVAALNARQAGGGGPQTVTGAPSPTTSASETGCHTSRSTTTTTCPIQSTGPGAGKDKLPCFPTTVSFLACREGYLCSADNQGLPTCLKLDGRLTMSGVIVACVFGFLAVGATVMICFFCCRERAEHRRLRRAAEAAATAREAQAAALLAKKKPSVAVRSVSASGRGDSEPLIAPQGSKGQGQQVAGQQQQQGQQGQAQHPYAAQHDPFADQQQHYQQQQYQGQAEYPHQQYPPQAY